MNEVVDTGKCVICVAVGLTLALAVSIGTLAVALNVLKAVLF